MAQLFVDGVPGPDLKIDVKYLSKDNLKLDLKIDVNIPNISSTKHRVFGSKSK